MTEQEQQAIRATILEATMLGRNEGISTAAEMVRAAADNDRILAWLQINPQDALRALAAAIEDTTTNKPPTENPSQQAND